MKNLDFQALIANRNWEELKKNIIKLPLGDIINLISSLPSTDILIILRLLPKEKQADIFSELDKENQLQILNGFSDKQIKILLHELNSDEKTELLEDLSPQLTQKLLNFLSPEQRKLILKFLDFPENSVGRMITTEYVVLKQNWTIEEAVAHIKEWGKDAETINMVYVVDEHWKLLDDIPIRRVILADNNQTVKDIMDYHFIALKATEDQEKAIKLFKKYDLVALPIIDSENIFLGIVTIDDILDAIQEENTEDFTKIGAVDVETKDLKFITNLKDIPISKIYKSRIVWLFALLLMDLLTGGIIQGFEATIAKYVVLVTFLPVLVDTAGNAGSQSATLVIRALALGTVQKKDWLYLFGKEFLVASLIGITMGLGISVMGIVRGKNIIIAEVVVISMIVNVIIGSLIGILLPFIFAKFKKDPATASTPLITTLADIIGTGIFLSTAYLILG